MVKNSKYSSKCRGNFCPAIGNNGVYAVPHQIPLHFPKTVINFHGHDSLYYILYTQSYS